VQMRIFGEYYLTLPNLYRKPWEQRYSHSKAPE
jgi:hypothetical protein